MSNRLGLDKIAEQDPHHHIVNSGKYFNEKCITSAKNKTIKHLKVKT